MSAVRRTRRRTVVVIFCDGCGVDYERLSESPALTDAVRTAQGDGWWASGPLGKTTRCPDCRTDAAAKL